MRNIFYKFTFAAFLVFAGFAFAFAKTPDAAQIKYEITPALRAESPKLKIILSFKGDKSGATKIRLPLEFGGQSKLYRCVENLRGVGSNFSIKNTEQPEIKIVEHEKGAIVRLAYELAQDWADAPQAGGASQNAGGGYRPILQPDYFHVLGAGAFVAPDLPGDLKMKISIEWKNIAPDFALANSFGIGGKKQTFSADAEQLASSVFVGGDFKIIRKSVEGKPVFVVMRGKWNFTNEEFAALVEKIVKVEREFWSDFKHPFYLATLLPIESDPNSKSIGGTGLTDSFAMFVTPNATLEDVAPLLAHEYFHNWNPTAFGKMRQPEQAVYWFSEGFTDYYAYLLLLRAGLLDLKKYVAKYDEFLSDYYLSPVRNETNERIVRDFFSDYTVSKLPYRRGMFLATKWNAIIRRQSGVAKSLDDAMRQILRDARAGKIKEISTDYLISVLSQYAKYDFAADVARYVESGETIGDFAGVFGECVESLNINSGKFEIGLDFETTRKDKVVAQVVKTSAAYAAGVRDGQKVLGLSVYFGDIIKPVELTIEENGQSRKITYSPETPEKTSIPQFKIKERLSPDETNRCLNAAKLF